MENKRIRMTVEFAVDEKMLQEKGIELEDVVNSIRFHNHDAVDGFEITTDISGCDCTSDFFLVGGDVVSVKEADKSKMDDRDIEILGDLYNRLLDDYNLNRPFEQKEEDRLVLGRLLEGVEKPPKSRLDKINAFKGNEAFLKATAEQKVQDETNGLVARIQALKPRIDELIKIGNACLENGIELNSYHNSGWFNRSNDCYERGTFVTNGISHRVGFVQTWGQHSKGSHSFVELGIDNGGACGRYDFRTDGEKVYFVNEDDKTDIKGPSQRMRDLKEFLEEFETFETAFYAYIDKVLDQQQKSVDNVLADAQSRSVASDGLEQSVSKDNIDKGME